MLINKYSPTDEQKIELINDLQVINEGTEKSSESARKLLSFINRVGVSLVSTALVKSLEVISG